MIKCPSCRKKNFSKIDNYNNYNIFRCNNCDLIFSNPFKNPGARFYESFYQDIGLHDPDRFGINSSQKLFLKRNNPGKILDIACGMGIFLHELEKKGFDTYGIDFDSESINLCRNHFKLKNVYNYDINDSRVNLFGKFDYISLIDVLEHVDNPNELISSIKSLLNNNGKIIVSLPNYNRKPDFIFKEGDSPPHHLTKWTVKSLSFILENNGFKVVYCRPVKFTSLVLVDFFRETIYTRTLNKLKKINRETLVKRSQITENLVVKNNFKSSVRSKIIYTIRDVLVLFLSILLIPLNFILVLLFNLESDHLYAEAVKI